LDRACSTLEEKESAYRIDSESQKKRNHKEGLDICGRIILKQVLER
jgi:hypothetical protein